MAWMYSPLALVYLVICLSLCGLAVLAARNRQTPGVTPLLWLLGLTALWVGLAAGKLASADPAQVRLLDDLSFVPVSLVPVAFLYFAEAYGGHETPLTRYGPVPLLVVPALTVLLTLTNGTHGLMWASRDVLVADTYAAMTPQRGPWFLVHSLYSYGLLVVGSYLLVRKFVVADHVYRGQAAAILLGVAAPWAVNALYLSGLYRPPFDTTPAATAASVALFTVAIYRHHLLELVPAAREVARDELIENLGEAVFVLDDRGRIVDCNGRASEVAGAGTEALVGEQLADAIPEVAEAVTDSADGTEHTELAMRRNGTARHYDVRVSPLSRTGGLVTGQLVSLRDVTDRRQREQRLNVLNRTLRHDLRNEANVILGYAELGMQQHPDAEWVAAIQDHVSGLVELSGKVRQLEQALDSANVGTTTVDICAVVEQSIAEVTADRPEVTIETDLPDAVHVSVIELVDAAVVNALENAVVHNDNPDPLVEVSVTVRETAADDVVVEIADNGPGIHEDERAVLLRGQETPLEHASGLGLWIINWIVTESGGTVSFAENEPRGSVVTLRLPKADHPPFDAGAGAEADPAEAEPDGGVPFESTNRD